MGVYLKNDLKKNHARERYMIVKFDEQYIYIQKFDKCMGKTWYKVRSSDIFHIIPSHCVDESVSSSSDEEDTVFPESKDNDLNSASSVPKVEVVKEFKSEEIPPVVNEPDESLGRGKRNKRKNPRIYNDEFKT